MTAETIEAADDGWRGVANERTTPIRRRQGCACRRRPGGCSARSSGRTGAPVVAALLLLVGQTLAELAGPLLVASAIDTGIPAAVAGDAAPLVWAIAGYAGSAAVAAGLRAAFLLLTGRVGQDVLLDVRRRVFAHGQRLSLDFHESFTSGRLISRLTSDVDALNDLLEKGLDGFGGAVLSLLGISVLLVWLDPVLAVIVLAGFVPLLLLTRWFQRRSRATYRRTRVTVARLIVQFVESMNGIRAVQAYRRERRNEEIMDRLGAAYRDANADSIRTVAWYVGSLRAVGNLTLALVLAVGGLRVAGGALELGALTAFLLYLRRFYDPLDELAQFFNAYQSAAAALEKIATVLDTPPGVPEPLAPVAAAVAGAGRAALRGRAVRLPVRPAAHRAAGAVADRARWRRPWRSSARQGRASRRWPSWPRGSTTRPTARSPSTASTCATSPTPSCARRW